MRRLNTDALKRSLPLSNLEEFSVTISSREQVALLTDYDGQSAYSIAYQQLYASIRLHWGSEQIKPQAVLLVAATAFPGYATAAANVAIAAAQSGIATILVDADLRTPGLHQRFGLDAHTGLSELLTEKHLSAQQIANSLSDTFVPGLRLLSAGRSSEGSTRFATRLHMVVAGLRQHLTQESEKDERRQAGLLIFSTTPVLSGAEAAFLSTQVDQTFLLLVAGQTKRAQARQAQEQLQKVHAKLVGAVLLDV
jgi:Mrp family chromosome partitioning ATPase